MWFPVAVRWLPLTAILHFTFLWLGCIALVAQHLITIKPSLSIRPLVCPVHCGKMADRIRMPFGIICQMDSGMRHIVWFGDRSMERHTFGGEFGVCHCNQWGLYGVHVRQCCNAALVPNYFGQTCCYYCCVSWRQDQMLQQVKQYVNGLLSRVISDEVRLSQLSQLCEPSAVQVTSTSGTQQHYL